jgi:hypothetical protein
VKTTTEKRGGDEFGVDFYVDLLMQQWRMGEQSPRIQTCVRKVLSEMEVSALLVLRREPRLEVIVRPDDALSVWAYFPIHCRRWIARQLHPKAQTRVLLVFSLPKCEKTPAKVLQDQIRDHLGHVLLYLRDPKARNECRDAMKEWRMCRSAQKHTARPKRRES